MSIKVSPLSRQNSRLQLQPAGYGFKKKKKQKQKPATGLNCLWLESCVFCSLNQHLNTQWRRPSLAWGMGHGTCGMNERFVGKPQKNFTIPARAVRRFLHLPQNWDFFLLRFQFKICAKVARNVAECGVSTLWVHSVCRRIVLRVLAGDAAKKVLLQIIMKISKIIEKIKIVWTRKVSR